MNYWLVKSEPSVCSIDYVKQNGFTLWDGVRNFQARNNLMNMKKGDLVLFYHSVEKPIGVAGIVKVIKEYYPDPTQFDKKNQYFEKRATLEKPVWFCPDFGFVKKFKRIVTLDELKAESKLSKMSLLQKGSRLSVHQIENYQFEFICELSERSILQVV